MERVLEPELMTDVDQAEAYAKADFSDGNAAFVQRFLAEFPDVRSGRLVDIGCGPADIPLRLAEALPEVAITCVDGSEQMLAPARREIAARGLGARLAVHQGLIPDDRLPAGGFAAILSNSLLHHLPDGLVFWREARRLGAPGAPVLVQDLFRPESTADAQAIVDRMAGNDPAILREDFYNSLRAAFTLDEVRDQLLAAGLSSFRCEQVSERHWAAWGRLD